MALAISSSSTVTISSTYFATSGKVISPARRTAIPSAMVEAGGMVTMLMLLDGQQHGRQARRLHADDFYLGTQLLDGAGHAGDQSAAANRHDDSFQLRALLEQLEADGALPGDDGDVVEGVQKDLALLARRASGRVRRPRRN